MYSLILFLIGFNFITYCDAAPIGKFFNDNSNKDQLKQVVYDSISQFTKDLTERHIIINGSLDTPIGFIDYVFNNISLSNIKIAPLSIELVSTQIIIRSSPVSLMLISNVTYTFRKFPMIKDSATLDMALVNSKIRVTFQVLQISLLKYKIIPEGVIVFIGDLDAMFYGKHNYIYNYLDKAIVSLMKGQLNFTYIMNSKLSLTVKKDGLYVTGHFTHLGTLLKAVNNTVLGQFSEMIGQTVVNILSQIFVIPVLNTYFSVGLRIPLKSAIDINNLNFEILSTPMKITMVYLSPEIIR